VDGTFALSGCSRTVLHTLAKLREWKVASGLSVNRKLSRNGLLGMLTSGPGLTSSLP
jgi:hypothetical protein